MVSALGQFVYLQARARQATGSRKGGASEELAGGVRGAARYVAWWRPVVGHVSEGRTHEATSMNLGHERRNRRRATSPLEAL